jgi:hypothetical protein
MKNTFRAIRYAVSGTRDNSIAYADKGGLSCVLKCVVYLVEIGDYGS